MQGYTVPRKGGWDCHGLPVEVQVEKALKLKSKKEVLKYGIGKFIEKSRESVFSYIEEWNKLTEKMAYWVDLENPYSTLDNKYIESVWWSLKELHSRGLLYEGHKVVPFCPRCETPLSSHEIALGYKDLVEKTVIVKFKLKDKANRYFLAWTTTPWTLPSNLALAVHPDFKYVVIKEGKNEYILAESFVDKYFDNPEIIETLTGSELEAMKYEPLFDYFKNLKKSFRVLLAKFVTAEEGTGIVHMAPAFGEDDYNLCKEEGVDFVQPITSSGIFTDEVSDFKGLFVKEADPKIIDWLEKKNKLFKVEEYEHTYPFCWRCDSPLIYYAMLSWFIKVSKFRDELLNFNDKINWYPKHIKEGRFGEWLSGAKDWALSRSKFWGTPLPIWRCKCGKERVIGSKEELERLSGKKIEDLHKPLIDEVKIKCECGKVMERVPEVIDCWYDSGSASFAQYHYPFENKEFVEKNLPYDFISEAIDQTRGWFYTLHVLGVLLFNKNAYSTCVCAGHVVDENGEKMSKSKGNVLDPWKVFDSVGVDAVRLQFCVTDPGSQKRFGIDLVNQLVSPFLRILWNCYIYTKQVENVKVKGSLQLEDKWIISKVNSLVSSVTGSLNDNDYHACLSKFINFVNEDLSRWYIKLVRDRKDKAVYETLIYVFDSLLKLLAPFAPYITESIYQDLIGKDKSIHFCSWPEIDKKKIDIKLEKQMDLAKEVVTLALAEREKVQLGVRWPLKKLEVSIEEPVNNLTNLIKQQVNVKTVVLKKGKLKVKLDTQLTKALEQEGFVRELMRKIQSLRKKNGLKMEDKIVLSILSDYDISKFKKQILDKVGAKSLDFKAKYYEINIEEKIKDRLFMISFQKV